MLHNQKSRWKLRCRSLKATSDHLQVDDEKNDREFAMVGRMLLTMVLIMSQFRALSNYMLSARSKKRKLWRNSGAIRRGGVHCRDYSDFSSCFYFNFTPQQNPLTGDSCEQYTEGVASLLSNTYLYTLSLLLSQSLSLFLPCTAHSLPFLILPTPSQGRL